MVLAGFWPKTKDPKVFHQDIPKLIILTLILISDRGVWMCLALPSSRSQTTGTAGRFPVRRGGLSFMGMCGVCGAPAT